MTLEVKIYTDGVVKIRICSHAKTEYGQPIFKEFEEYDVLKLKFPKLENLKHYLSFVWGVNERYADALSFMLQNDAEITIGGVDLVEEIDR